MSLSMLSREVAYALVQDGSFPLQVKEGLGLSDVTYHIRKLQDYGIIAPADPNAKRNRNYVRGPNYESIICTELCPHCEKEVELLPDKISQCPSCDAWIVPCSGCTTLDFCTCGDCSMRIRAEQLNSKTTSDGEVVAISPGDRTSDIPSPSPGKPLPRRLREDYAGYIAAYNRDVARNFARMADALDDVIGMLRAVEENLRKIDNNIVSCEELDLALGGVTFALGVLGGGTS